MDEVKVPSQVADQANRMESELTKLSDEIRNLRDRLASVLKEREKAIGEEEEPISTLVPLARTLRDYGNRVSFSICEIAEIINLLEV